MFVDVYIAVFSDRSSNLLGSTKFDYNVLFKTIYIFDIKNIKREYILCFFSLDVITTTSIIITSKQE